jgi:hypothetical protein
LLRKLRKIRASNASQEKYKFWGFVNFPKFSPEPNRKERKINSGGKVTGVPYFWQMEAGSIGSGESPNYYYYLDNFKFLRGRGFVL